MKKLLKFGKRKAAFIGLATLVLSFGLILGACDHGLHTHDETTAASSEVTEAVGSVNTPHAKAANIVDAVNGLLNELQTNFKTIKVKFEVQNGGGGLWGTEGIVSTQDDTYLVRDSDEYANDFTISITVPASDQYLNIRWRASEYEVSAANTTKARTYVTAKMPVSGAGNYTIGLDYNGIGEVATTNLYDVQVGWNYNKDNGIPTEQFTEFQNAWNRAIDD